MEENLKGYTSISLSEINAIIKKARTYRKSVGSKLHPWDRIMIELTVLQDRPELEVQGMYQVQLNKFEVG